MARSLAMLEVLLLDLSSRYGAADELALKVQMALNAKLAHVDLAERSRRKSNAMTPRHVRLNDQDTNRRQGLRHH